MAKQGNKGWLAPVAAVVVLLGVVGVVVVMGLGGGGGDEAGEARLAASDAEARLEIDPVLESASYLIRTTEIDKAALLLEKLLEKYPDEPSGHLLMAQVCMYREQSEAALDHFEKSLALDPAQDQVHHLVGTMLARNGDEAGAERHYRDAMRLNPMEPDYPLYLGRLLLAQNELDEAQIVLLTAARLDSNKPEVYSVLAGVSEQRGKLDMAIGQITRAIELAGEEDRKYLAYVLQKAVYLRRDAEPRAAIELVDGLAAKYQMHPEVVRHRAAGYQMLGEHETAGRAWAALFALDQSNVTAAVETGLCFAKAGDAEQAKQWLSIAEHVNREEPLIGALVKAIENLESGGTG